MWYNGTAVLEAPGGWWEPVRGGGSYVHVQGDWAKATPAQRRALPALSGGAGKTPQRSCLLIKTVWAPIRRGVGAEGWASSHACEQTPRQAAGVRAEARGLVCFGAKSLSARRHTHVQPGHMRLLGGPRHGWEGLLCVRGRFNVDGCLDLYY